MLKIAIAIFFIVAHGFNWYTTKRTQVDYRRFFYEINPLLGKDPNIVTIGFYFVLTGVVALTMLMILPRWWGIILVGTYGTLNVVLGIRDSYLLYKIQRRPAAPRNIRIIFKEG